MAKDKKKADGQRLKEAFKGRKAWGEEGR